MRLLSELRYEQRQPARFYTALAKDTAALVDDLWRATHGEPAGGRVLLDVGGGPGYFASAFADLGVHYVAVEPDPSQIHHAMYAAPTLNRGRCGREERNNGGLFVRASGTALPFRDRCVDICLSSNVAEHVREPWRLGAELLRVTKPGGLAVLSYTVWLSPFGGHEMGPTHYFGGARAARWYSSRHGHPPKNNYGSSLFAVSAADGLRWANSTGVLVAAFPRYHPRWAWWVTSVPRLREFAVSNLVLVLQPSGAPD